MLKSVVSAHFREGENGVARDSTARSLHRRVGSKDGETVFPDCSAAASSNPKLEQTVQLAEVK
jgi:hypothetical protein